MSSINRMFLKALGCFLSIFLVAVGVSFFVDFNNFYYHVIYDYYYDYNQPLAILRLFVFFSLLYVYILMFLSAKSNKELIYFVISNLIAIIVTLICNKFIFQNTDYTLSTYFGVFCIISFSSGYLFDRFLDKEYDLSSEIAIDFFKLLGFLFFGTLVFSRTYWCLNYFEDYASNPLKIFNIFEMFNETYLEYFMQVFILIYTALCALTFLLFVIVNLSTVVTYADMFIGSDFYEYYEEESDEVEEFMADSIEKSDESFKQVEKEEDKG
ncbi:MAG: hypothetical protein ACI4PU_00830 [Intestinibacter sp.]